MANIVNCLLDVNIKYVSPPNINKSLSLIFAFVNINTAKKIINVHIIGNYLHIQEDSELAEPRVVVIDNCDGAIENYELTVTHDGADVPVKDGKFTVPTAGDYTLTVSAQDKAGTLCNTADSLAQREFPNPRHSRFGQILFSGNSNHFNLSFVRKVLQAARSGHFRSRHSYTLSSAGAISS